MIQLTARATSLVKATDGWNVLYEEHNWFQGEDNGFIDLVIEDHNRTWLMNIECKRVRDTKWIFLKDTAAKSTRKHVKLWISSKKDDESLNHFGWVDVPMEPDTVQSSYCIVPGQDNKARPMLERIAIDVVKSTEALALEETETLSSYYSGLRIYQNVIVTTAELYVCDTDISEIDITTGEISVTSTFTPVPYVRFRKQVGAIDTSLKPAKRINELRRIITVRESTIFVVNSSHLGDYLNKCEMPDDLVRFIKH